MAVRAASGGTRRERERAPHPEVERPSDLSGQEAGVIRPSPPSGYCSAEMTPPRSPTR